MSFTLKFDEKKVIGQMNEAVADTLEVLALRIMNDSQEEVPVRTGNLQSSAFIVSERDQLSVKIGYKAPHAHLVHEKNRNGAKYLEAPMHDHAGDLEEMCNKAMAAGVNGGTWEKPSASELRKFDWDNYQRTPKGKGKSKKNYQAPYRESNNATGQMIADLQAGVDIKDRRY